MVIAPTTPAMIRQQPTIRASSAAVVAKSDDPETATVQQTATAFTAVVDASIAAITGLAAITAGYSG